MGVDCAGEEFADAGGNDMSEASADLLATLELAAVALVLAGQEAFTQGAVFTGQDTQDKVAPCVICEAGGEAEEDPPNTGNCWVDLSVILKWPAAIDADGEDPKPANDAAVRTVFTLFKSQTLPADINALGTPNFTVLGVINRVPSFQDEGDELVNTLKMRVYCCASTLPA
jgi:hypothetical protein